MDTDTGLCTVNSMREQPRAKQQDSATRHSRALLSALMFTALSVSVISTLGAPMVPTIAHEQNVSLGTAQWILTVTLLAGAISGPILGRLGDGPRRKGSIQGALAAVLAGSLLAALAPNFPVLIAGRALQGVGMGLVPLTIAVAREHLQPALLRSGVASLSITTSVGAGIGYPITGLIAQYLNYHAGFWFAALLTACSLTIVSWLVPRGSAVPHRPLDTVGAVLLCSGLGAVLLTLSQISHWGLKSTATWIGAGAGVVLLTVWVFHALRTHHPLVTLRLVRHRAVLAANVTALLMGVGMYSGLSLVNLYTQVPSGAGYGLHLSLALAGLVLMPIALGSLLANRLASALVGRFGLYRILPLGAALCCLDLVVLALWRQELVVLLIGTFLLGAGVGAAYAAMPVLIVRSVPAAETGSAMSLNQVLRTVGGSVGSAAISAIMIAYTPAGDAVPLEHAYSVALWVTAAVSLLGALAAIVIPGRRGSAASSEPSVTVAGGAPVVEQD
ncbi:MFS transporter [Streptomyces sp. NPDC046805]|uniref:MFS transporter n=1 Tax=Streptomyces sp. NPDC046805 TaxID=3155134 RepID=UPI0033DA2A00